MLKFILKKKKKLIFHNRIGIIAIFLNGLDITDARFARAI